MTLSTERVGRRARGDQGAAIVEFALVAVLLLTIVFGIINFGLILSFKQDVTRAAAEGARAGAVALPSTTEGFLDARRLAADVATRQAVEGFNQECGVGGMSCIAQIHDCDFTPPNDTSEVPNAGYSTTPAPDCVTVKITYDYENDPIIVPVPLFEPFIPEQIKATSVVRLNQ